MVETHGEALYTSDQYFAFVQMGQLQADDRVELLEGVIVTMPPHEPPHASGITLVNDALRDVIGRRAVIRVQLPLILGKHSVPEPDVAVVAGMAADYFRAHPTTALLVVEIADSSLAQDRLSKSRIYAGAAIPECWLVNLRDQCVEVFRRPLQATRNYGETTRARHGDRIELVTLPDLTVAVADLLPRGAYYRSP